MFLLSDVHLNLISPKQEVTLSPPVASLSVKKEYIVNNSQKTTFSFFRQVFLRRPVHFLELLNLLKAFSLAFLRTTHPSKTILEALAQLKKVNLAGCDSLVRSIKSQSVQFCFSPLRTEIGTTTRDLDCGTDSCSIPPSAVEEVELMMAE